FALNISASVADSDQSLEIILTNVDGTLNNGTDNGNGQWTLLESDLSGLKITPSTDVSGDFDIGVKAVTQDGSAAAVETAVETISVNAESDETFTMSNTNLDGFAGSDTLTISGNDNIDFTNLTNTVKNIESVDLETGTHNITISLDNVLDMTDNNNSLDITAITDDNDAIEIDTAGWTGTSTDNGSETTYTYTKDGSADSITLTVDDTIDQSVI
ncbi:MAG: hypothetical protein GQ474_02520, partial [Sulfurimonas sp.]|nr:hypothetical protein [Sulfurimonas sp.]